MGKRAKWSVAGALMAGVLVLAGLPVGPGQAVFDLVFPGKKAKATPVVLTAAVEATAPTVTTSTTRTSMAMSAHQATPGQVPTATTVASSEAPATTAETMATASEITAVGPAVAQAAVLPTTSVAPPTMTTGPVVDDRLPSAAVYTFPQCAGPKIVDQTGKPYDPAKPYIVEVVPAPLPINYETVIGDQLAAQILQRREVVIRSVVAVVAPDATEESPPLLVWRIAGDTPLCNIAALVEVDRVLVQLPPEEIILVPA